MKDTSRLHIEALDKALEIAILLRDSEAAHARDRVRGASFGVVGDRQRLDALTLGMLDALARMVGNGGSSLPMLVYLKTLVDHGAGTRAREGFLAMLRLLDLAGLNRYVAAGRKLVTQILKGGESAPGRYADLLERELRELSA